MPKQSFSSGQTLLSSQMNDLQTNDFNQTVSTKTAAYTFVVGDRGTRVVLNDTTARTFTIDDAIFSAGDTIQVHNINTGVLTIAAGAGVTLNGADVLTVAQYQGGTIFFTSASSAIFFPTAKTVSAAGLVVVKAETAISAAGSVTADNVFTSTYTNYRINLVYNTSTTNDVSLKLRAGGSSASTNYNRQTFTSTSTTNTGANSTGQSSLIVGPNSNGTRRCYATIDVSGPETSDQTAFQVNVTLFQGDNAGRIFFSYGMHDTSSAHDGFELLVATGNFSGSYTVYGYGKSL